MISPASTSTIPDSPPPDWSACLAAEGSLSTGLRQSYRVALERFLAFCAGRQEAPSVSLARDYVELARLEYAPSPARLQDWKDALNWYFRLGRPTRAPELKGVPPLARTDLGRTPWEAALIAGVRQQHRAWRTEQTYRGWMWRFVKWLGKRPLSEAGTVEVKAFLSELAVTQRLGVSAQKQALHPVR